MNKIVFQSTKYINYKWKSRIAQKKQIQQERSAISEFKNLSRAELAIIKLIHYSPTKIVYLPINRIDVNLLLHKKYIEQVNISDPKVYITGGIHHNDWYLKERRAFYTITKETQKIIEKPEIKALLKKIHINKNLRKASQC